MTKDVMLNAISEQLRHNRTEMYKDGKFDDVAHYYLTEQQSRLLQIYNDIFNMESLDKYKTIVDGYGNDHIVEVANLISFKKNYRRRQLNELYKRRLH